MIEHHLDTAHSILYLRPTSALEEADFVQLAKAVDPFIQATGGLSGLIIEAAKFPGWDSLGAMAGHFRFVRDHHQHIKKIGLVTDSALGNVAEHLASHFVSAEIRHFSAGDLEAATRWVLDQPAPGDAPMRLGNFSVSLAVKDIGASRVFYEKLGFRVVMGDQARNWLILQNETSTIGLFQGMFSQNTLTFNPGWDRKGGALPDFDDVRAIQRTLKSRGLTLASEANESTTGPASLMVMDPDGNPILIDQHVPSPKP